MNDSHEGCTPNEVLSTDSVNNGIGIKISEEALTTERQKDNFWKKIDKSSHPKGRWEWRASRDDWNYGTFGVRQKAKKAHRISWTISNGPIPTEMRVCHKCDNPPCCNPDHLFLGTDQDNTDDKLAKGRGKHRGEESPRAKLTDEIVRTIRAEYVAGINTIVLGLKYGLNKSTVSKIILRKRWAHVD